ncbi:MAG: hypothetical protein WB626_07510 [Bacteroidota bacterium]
MLPSPRSARARHLAACLLVLAAEAAAQVSTGVLVHTPPEAPARHPLLVQADLLQGGLVDRVEILYRPFGTGEYSRIEMDIRGNRASAYIPGKDILPPSLEFYLVLWKRDGSLETHPLGEGGDPFATPPGKTLLLPVRAEDPSEEQILILSPEPGAVMEPEEVLISASLLRADTTVDRGATRVYLDGADVTSAALIAEDLVIFLPSNAGRAPAPGQHRVTVELYDRQGTARASKSISFVVRGGREPGAEPGISGIGASAQWESRHERIAGTAGWFHRGSIRLDGRHGSWRTGASLFLSSDEKPDRQPQHRYDITVESPWLRAGYGDESPAFTPLILSGKRVRGLHAGLRLGFFRMDMALGSVTRGVEGELLARIPADSLAAEQGRNPGASYAPLDSGSWGKFRYGTYERKLFALRPVFGSDNGFRWAFTWLSSRDDPGSIRYGIRPQENLVAGTDFRAPIAGGLLELTGEGAFSAYNNDISSGTFTDAYIDSVYPNDAGAIRALRDALGGLITVNDNLRPLSFKRLSTLAWELGLGVNLPSHTLRGSYLYRGADYNSFGQTFLRKDLRGFSISDRARLVRNQVFLTAGYERLEDNTGGAKAATTVFRTATLSLSWYPLEGLPSVTAGYSRLASDNRLDAGDPGAVDETTNRLFVQSTHRFRLGADHTAGASAAWSDRRDRSARDLDVRNVSLGLSLETRYAVPLETSAEISLNLNDLPGGSQAGVRGRLNYTTLTGAARYGLLPGVLALHARAAPTFGDFTRTAFGAGASWTALPGLALSLDVTGYRQPSGLHDAVWSFRTRYDMP